MILVGPLDYEYRDAEECAAHMHRCENEGRCIKILNADNRLQGVMYHPPYVCECPDAYEGYYCESKILGKLC